MLVLEPTLLEEWLVVQRQQLLRFLFQSRTMQPEKVQFLLPPPLISFASASSSSANIGARTRAGGRSSRGRSPQLQPIVLTKQEITGISLECILSSNTASSFLRQSSRAKLNFTDEGSGRGGTLLLRVRAQREMRRFVVIHQLLFAGVVEPEAIFIRLPEDALCSMRTVRHYRQRLLDATLLQMLTDYLSNQYSAYAS
jgi:hypothetical protein